MEYTFGQLRKIADSLKERYPIGTRIKLLIMGDDPNPIPSGTKGTVEGIDDIATVFCLFDNGRSLGLAYGEDRYRALTHAELIEEKSQKNFEAFTARVDRDILGEIDFERLKEETEQGKDSYIQEILTLLHDTFADIYGTDSVNEDFGFIEVPAMIESVKTGKYYPGLVRLDMSSSGEHFGTTVIAPEGIIDQNDDENTEEEIAFWKDLIPYRYWYTVQCDGDIHVDMAECPEHIRDIISEAAGQTFNQDGGMDL